MNLKINPIIIVIGTRPEALKLVPVFFALKKLGLPVKICATYQHTDLLQGVFDLFKIVPDFSFKVMQQNQDLFHITQVVLQNCKELFLLVQPQLIIVQGDTTSAMAAALAAFYLQIPIAHVEAGLRTNNLQRPFPEEFNRQLISLVAKYNFAPTLFAFQNLQKTGVQAQQIFLVGNPIIDLLDQVLNQIAQGLLAISVGLKDLVLKQKNQHKKLVLLTMHRRESFGKDMQQAMLAIKDFALQNSDVTVIFPVHPNPQILLCIDQINLQACKNIKLLEPLNYYDFIYLLNQVNCILTDSGGVQEEAASLGKPVILLRRETDRPEALQAGFSYLAGYDQQKIQQYLKAALIWSADNPKTQIYGDGQAAIKIAQIIKQDIEMIKVVVVGLGYIGLPTAILLAEHGFAVHGYDIDIQKINLLKQGIAPIQEQELQARLKVSAQQHNLSFNLCMDAADVFLIAVPTPINQAKQADLSALWQAVNSVAKYLRVGNCVIIESTVPVGTTRQIASYLAQQTGLVLGLDFFVAFSPERVIPGQIFYELVHNARLVGGVDLSSNKIAQQFYANFVKGTISQTTAETAEMVKLVENASRDVQIAFANQVADLAQIAGIDPIAVINFANKHPRVNILNPGCGVGGHCIAVDPWFLIQSYPDQTKLLQAARNINDQKPLQVVAQAQQSILKLKKQLNKPKIEVLVLGVTYKPDTDDLRNSPALSIAQALENLPDITLTVVEPHLDLQVLNQHFKYAVNKLEHVIAPPDLVLVLVAHAQFKKLPQNWLTNLNVLDFCAATKNADILNL